MYNTFTSSMNMSPLLHDLKHIKARYCLLGIRLGVSQLRSHRLRFARTAEADLACPFCISEIESEIRFMLCCPMYNDLRDKYKYATLFELSMLFASENKYLQLRLATFLHKVFDIRNTVLCGRMLYLWGLTLTQSCLTVFVTTTDMGPWSFSISHSDSLPLSLSSFVYGLWPMYNKQTIRVRSVCLSACLSVCLPVCLSVCLSLSLSLSLWYTFKS